MKKSLEKFVQQVPVEMDQCICLKISKELLGTAKDLLLYCIYIHPYLSKYYDRKEFSNSLDILEEVLSNEEESGRDNYYMVIGDMN